MRAQQNENAANAAACAAAAKREAFDRSASAPLSGGA